MPVSLVEINAKNKAFNTYDSKGRRATDALFSDAISDGTKVVIIKGPYTGQPGVVAESFKGTYAISVKTSGGFNVLKYFTSEEFRPA